MTRDAHRRRRPRSPATRWRPHAAAAAHRGAPPVPGCGHPVAWRLLLEVLERARLEQRAIGVVGHGCYTGIVTCSDIECLQCLHGRAPAVATGVKRVQPEPRCSPSRRRRHGQRGPARGPPRAARGERITSIMLNNGVFGDTGGQMTATTVVGQRTKTSLEGRDPELHGYPIPVADMIATLPGAAYVARGAVNNAGSIAQTKRFLTRAFETQLAGDGFQLRRDPHHVPDRMVHPDGQRARLRRRDVRGDVPGRPVKTTAVTTAAEDAEPTRPQGVTGERGGAMDLLLRRHPPLVRRPDAPAGRS